MDSLNNQIKISISFRQLFFLTLAQSGGAAIIYLPGIIQGGNDVWLSNILASIVAYVVIYVHYLPMSLCPG